MQVVVMDRVSLATSMTTGPSVVIGPIVVPQELRIWASNDAYSKHICRQIQSSLRRCGYISLERQNCGESLEARQMNRLDQLTTFSQRKEGGKHAAEVASSPYYIQLRE